MTQAEHSTPSEMVAPTALAQEIGELKQMVAQLLLQKTTPQRLYSFSEAASAVFQGGSDTNKQAKLRRRVESGLYRLGHEVFDLASPDAKNARWHFDLEACAKRDRTPRHLR